MRRPSVLPTGAMMGQAPFPLGIGLPGDLAGGALSPALSPAGELSAKAEDMHGKVRKPYTITKQRENWTEQEHSKFLKALELFDRDWRKIEEYVGTKTVIQIRSHAQKYFLKVQKLGQDAHVPPPRPKRKSSQPYPQKASKVVAAVQLAHPAVVAGQPLSSQDGVYASGGAHPAVPPQSPQEEAGGLGASAWGLDTPTKANPDFAKVYRFLGDVFEIGVAGNLQKLKCMPPIDRETIILLMRNLAINLSSPVFAEQQHILAMADSSARSQQLEDQAQLPGGHRESSSAPPTPSDVLVSPGSQSELVGTGSPFLGSSGLGEGSHHQQRSAHVEQDGRRGVAIRAFGDGVPLGMGLGFGVAQTHQADGRMIDAGRVSSAGGGDEVRLDC